MYPGWRTFNPYLYPPYMYTNVRATQLYTCLVKPSSQMTTCTMSPQRQLCAVQY